MTAYITRLKAIVAEDAALAAKRNSQSIKDVHDRLAPLEHRLVRLLDTIPLELQRQGLSLMSLQISLRGRWRGSCHPGELGAALRKLGFQRRRQWRSEAGFQALWFPS